MLHSVKYWDNAGECNNKREEIRWEWKKDIFVDNSVIHREVEKDPILDLREGVIQQSELPLLLVERNSLGVPPPDTSTTVRIPNSYQRQDRSRHVHTVDTPVPAATQNNEIPILWYREDESSITLTSIGYSWYLGQQAEEAENDSWGERMVGEDSFQVAVATV